MANEITVVPKTEITFYEKFSDPLAAVERLGTFFGKSGLFGCDRVEAGMVLAFICLAEKKSPTDLLRTYHIVDGKLSKKAMAALAEFRQIGGKHEWVSTGDDGKEAILKLTYQGQSITGKFSIEDAKKQNLVKPNSGWVKTPGNMLRARVTSNTIALLTPEIFAGEDDATESTTTGPALDLSKPSGATVVADNPPEKPSAARQQAPIEVEATVTPKQTKAAPSTPDPIKEMEQPKVEVMPDIQPPTLTPKTMDHFRKICGSNYDAVVKNLEAFGWVKNGAAELITAKRMENIFSNPQGFMQRFGPK